MTGRALVIGILCIVGGIAGLTQRLEAQSHDDEEDLSTGEISAEISSADSISDEASFEEESSDDLSSPNSGNSRIARPQTPVEPSR
jgi:hypothetical protein